ncbi:PfkB family carbohydrate kinase [Anaeromyxobacter sp. Fw109-5]|uniref:PfkB family carbohydrate kinase n=1 Tax=Anaeromyxobacter sp. (strain Fw109-5) TaxID=404589 RepID=UPI000158A6AC|nr:PfkB family carbohydrate kinase [Anaeromyxobacter sp. Fw109-5]ABS27147.1 PfkB domain protein [Anaeromyxobacter sp. Fw109-5]
MSAARPVAVVCGNVTLDRVGAGLVPGGSAWYAAHTLRALGADARVLTSSGADYPREALAGVEARIAPAPRTTLFVNVHAPGGERTQRVEAAAPPLDPASLPAEWRGADVLHLAPVLGELSPRAFADVAGAGRVGLGVQGLVRAVAPDGAVLQPRWSFAPEDLAGVTAAFVGEDDLRGQGDLLARLSAAVPIVVFTRGAAGCEIMAEGRTLRVGVFPTREVDPTGAGDVFAAGFLFALARGADLAEAGRLAAAAASIVVEGVGGETLGRVGEAFQRARIVTVAG